MTRGLDIEDAGQGVELLTLNWDALGAVVAGTAMDRCERELREAALEVGSGMGSRG